METLLMKFFVFFLVYIMLTVTVLFFMLSGSLEGVWCCMLLVAVVSIIMGLFSGVWYSYSLYMVILGGLLILFMYICSISPSVSSDLLYPLVVSAGSSFIMSGLVVMISGFLTFSSMGFVFKVYFLKFGFVSFLFFMFLLFFLFFVGLMIGEFWGPLRKVYYI